ncbi:septal ring lytic transglycosylase RlpA family protein [Negadavirga shengliensis]|uniref:Probable endolytic peptidoglycan transglycosylase RlpA n=1 Tax=Negadavirga shengliensis TaxID=1389218 RepID=A0ABV9SYD9_9BACT
MSFAIVAIMRKLFMCLLLSGMLGCFTAKAKAQSPFTAPDSLLTIQTGVASFYGKRFHQRKTASGETYDMREFTAAHKHLPFGTMLKVTNLRNGFQAIIKVNDRLPGSSGRIIDLSRGVAEHLGMVMDGITEVKLELLSHQAIAWVRDQYEDVPGDIRLRDYQVSVAYKKDESLLFEAGIFFETAVF